MKRKDTCDWICSQVSFLFYLGFRLNFAGDRFHPKTEIEQIGSPWKESAPTGKILFGGGEHQLDTVELVDFAGARVVVHGGDIGLRVSLF